jgi:hypothetical protein
MKEAKEIARQLRAVASTESPCDKKEMRKLAKLIQDGKNKEAYKFFHSMDTFVREGVPEKVYQYIMLNRVKSRKFVDVTVKLRGCKEKIGTKEGFGAGEIFKAAFEFPGNASNEEIAIGIMNTEKKIIEDLIEIEYSEPKKRRAK